MYALKSQSNNLSSNLKVLGKEQNKPNTNRRKIMKIRAEINDTENKNNRENKERAGTLKRF